MLMLGDILGAARRSTAGFEVWLEAAEPALADEVQKAASQAGEALPGFVRGAVADFTRFADEEAWARLMSQVRDAADPGLACLCGMVRWRLTVADRAVLVSGKGDDDERHSAAIPSAAG
jgi:hypothetical protein